MKKSFVVLMILLTVCACGVIFAGCYVLKDKEAVEITETVVYGDRTLANQVNVTSKFRWGGYLHWTMNYVPGEEVQTEYWFTPDYTTNWREAESFSQGINLKSYQSGGVGRFLVNNTEETEKTSQTDPLEQAYKELAAEEFTGEREREIRIADYMPIIL